MGLKLGLLLYLQLLLPFAASLLVHLVVLFEAERNARQLFEEMLVLHLRAWRQKICCLLLLLGSMLNAEAISFAFFVF